MALSDRAMNALGWAYGSILGGAYNGATTSEIWDSLRAAAEAQGLDTVGLSAVDVSQLRSYASQVVSASNSLASADPSQVIDSSMIGYQPWSMDLNTLANAPEYWARVEMTTSDEQGNLQTGWITLTGINSLNMTVGDLNTIIQGNAIAAAATAPDGSSYGGDFVSTGRVELIVAPQA